MPSTDWASRGVRHQRGHLVLELPRSQTRRAGELGHNNAPKFDEVGVDSEAWVKRPTGTPHGWQVEIFRRGTLFRARAQQRVEVWWGFGSILEVDSNCLLTHLMCGKGFVGFVLGQLGLSPIPQSLAACGRNRYVKHCFFP